MQFWRFLEGFFFRTSVFGPKSDPCYLPFTCNPAALSCPNTCILHLQHPVTSMRHAEGNEEEEGEDEEEREEDKRRGVVWRWCASLPDDLMQGKKEAEPGVTFHSLPWWIKWGLSLCGDTPEDWENFICTFTSNDRYQVRPKLYLDCFYKMPAST